MGRMSLSIYMKGDYEDFHALWRREFKAKQSQFAWEAEPAQAIPIPINDNRDEAATRPAHLKGYGLKKQSQFEAAGSDSAFEFEGKNLCKWFKIQKT